MLLCFVGFLLVASQVACSGASWSLFPELPAEILGKHHVEKRQGIKISLQMPPCMHPVYNFFPLSTVFCFHKNNSMLFSHGPLLAVSIVVHSFANFVIVHSIFEKKNITYYVYCLSFIAATVAPGLPGESFFFNHYLFLWGDTDSVSANSCTYPYTVLQIIITYLFDILCVKLYPLICILSYHFKLLIVFVIFIPQFARESN